MRRLWRLRSMNLSDRDRPTCTSEAGRVAARRSPRSLKAIISNSTFGLPETFPGNSKIFAVFCRRPDRHL